VPQFKNIDVVFIVLEPPNKMGRLIVAKVKIERSTKNIVEDTVLRNLFDLEKMRRITTVIYGRPMTGKTLLTAYEAARLAKIYGGGVLIYTSEPNYVVDETYNALRSIFEALKVPYEIRFEESSDRLSMELFKLTKEVKEERESLSQEEQTKWVPQWRVVIIDSLGSLAASEEDYLGYYMRKSPRTRSSAVVPALARVVRNLSRYAAEAYGWGFAIAHATSTAGSGLYEGLVEYKPSFTEKAIHYCGAVVWLASAKDFPDNVKKKVLNMEKRLKDVKMAVLVMHRSGGAGRGVVFEFSSASESSITYPKPVPLFFVDYQHEEEEMV